jgi:type IV pilus biogenesis protein CpaD/CtpE
MSGQVSSMLKRESKTLQQIIRTLSVMAVSATLAGCALDDFAKEDTFEPYGGSKQHPIRVVNGKAVVDKCGDWSEDVTDTGENQLMLNHGCAIQSNIAAMAAKPTDLVRARRMTRAPAYSRTPAIDGLSGTSSGGTSGGTGGTGGAAAAPKP